MSQRSSKDLLVLVPDADVHAIIDSLLGRTKALGTREIQFDIYRHIERDSGCAKKAVTYLRPFLRQYDYALVCFDRHGSGMEALSREKISDKLTQNLERNGWNDRCAVVVFDPEIEIWLWTGSSVVSKALGWHEDYRSMQVWLTAQGWWKAGEAKPQHPKDALRAALRATDRRRSSYVFKVIARKSTFRHCSDRSFLQLAETLRAWFPR